MGKQKRYVSGKDFKDMKQTVDDENDAEAQHEKDLDKKPIMAKLKEHLKKKKVSDEEYKSTVAKATKAHDDVLASGGSMDDANTAYGKAMSTLPSTKEGRASMRKMPKDVRDKPKRSRSKKSKDTGDSMNEKRDSSGRWTT